VCQHTPNTTEYQRKTHLKTQIPPKCHESGLVAIQIAVFSIAGRYLDSVPFNPWGAPLIMALAMVGVHVLVCVIQVIRAYRGTTLRFGGFPFFR